MSWIKDNKFLAALGGGTLVIAILLFVVGSKWANQYDGAKEEFEAAAGEAAGFERLPLYPNRENLAGKSKALDEYRQALETLQTAFEPYRPDELANISPEAFTNRLKSANDQIREALGEAGIVVPDQFFAGFERYKTILAPGRATGILDHELTGITNLMLDLAASGVTELKNVHRPELPEEQGGEFTPEPTQVARQLPLEITFQGSEKSVRAFLSSIVKPDGYYTVIRSLRVTNTKKDPPRTADAEFARSAADAAAPAPAVASPFGSFFQLEEEEAAPAEKEPTEPAEPAVAPPAAGTASGDSDRILSQVLGDEELQVFLRLDLLQFLPAKKLP